MGIWKQIIKSVVSEPMEVVKDAIGANLEQNKATQPAATQPGGQANNNPMADLAKAGFKTQEDFTKYAGKSQQKDQLELEMTRKQLVRQWGLDTTIEGGMQKARIEWEQKEEQRKKVEEKKEEQKKEFEFQKKEAEDIGLKAAVSEASAENKALGAG